MCNRYITPDQAEIESYFHLRPTDVTWPSEEIFPFRQGPYVRGIPGSDIPELVVGQWGMIRPGSPKNDKKYSTNNARTEDMAKKPTYRDAWKKGQRCLIPAFTFAEPNWETGKNVWWNFKRADGQPWALAGLWSEWKDPATGELIPNYTMLTVNADDHRLMKRMHKPEKDKEGNALPAEKQDKRSVVALEPGFWEVWLHGTEEEARALFQAPSMDVIVGEPERK